MASEPVEAVATATQHIAPGITLRWIARACLSLSFVLIIFYVSGFGWSVLTSWPMLTALVLFIIALRWELAGGIGLIALCLGYVLYATYITWEQEHFTASSFFPVLTVGFGSIYSLIAYAALLLPGLLLISSWRMNRRVS
jgi:hypothetical protein